jgi:hypothetical protein
MTIGGMAFGLACFCLLALTAIAGTGTAAAAECPNEAIRIAQGATRLPDCRAYERISPADGKGGLVGVDTKNLPMFAAIRADGNAATFGSSSAVGETERGATTSSNLARRTADGWTSFNVLNSTEPSVPWDLSMFAGWPTPSTDMSRELFVSSRSLGPPNTLAGGGSVYLSATDGQGVPTWLSRWSLPGTQPTPPGRALPLGGAPNFSSGYFTYPTPLTTLAGDQARTVGWGLYFFEGSTIHPAGVLPSGTVDPLGALAAGTGQDLIGYISELAGNQVSADGSKLFFVSPAESSEPKQLYVEEGGKPGRLISHDVLGNAAAAGITELRSANVSSAGRSNFALATPDGSRVIFRSESALTADAPAGGLKTYRADISPSAVRLEYLPAVAGAPLAIDEDASKVLFSITGAAPGESSYYVWDEGRPAAPYLVVGDMASSGGPVMAEPTFSEDGDVLVFASGAEMEPGVAPRPEVAYTQVYRWTEGSAFPSCISCLRDGGAPARFGSRMTSLNGLPTDNPASPTGAAYEVFNQSTVVGNRKISSDGSRVFFDTNDPLDAARDVNGSRDVYMWENGKDYLLTSGRGTTPSYVFDSSESGNDVMLVTKDGLIPSDTNDTYDVYDVRVDGGFPEPVTEGCEGDSCQAASAAPGASSPASRNVRGPGNQRLAKVAAVKIAQLGKPGKKARVRVEVPAAGRLKLGGKLLRSQSRAVKAKGTVKATLRLTKAGKRKLAAKGSLATKVTATFRDGEGRTKRNSVTLRFKQRSHR